MKFKQEERTQAILNILDKVDFISTTELQKELDITTSTLRRDLIRLESSNVIKRAHGYVGLLKNSNMEIEYSVRRQKHEREKKRICESAAALIYDHDSIFLDASSTLAFLPKYFSGKNELTVTTNSLHIALSVNNLKNIKLYILGGIIPYETASILGSKALTDLLESYRPNQAFLSCSALDENGIYGISNDQTTMKRTIIKCAEEAILMVDHSKFNQKDTLLLSSYTNTHISTIITDRQPNPKTTAAIVNAGIKLVIA